MPCYDPEAERDARRQEDVEKNNQINMLTRMLCQCCQDIEGSGRTVPLMVRAWWNNHKAYDEYRRSVDPSYDNPHLPTGGSS